MSAETAGRRGEFADSPTEIPAKGWRQVMRRVWRQISDDNLSLVSAGVAFYGLLAIFPALAALVMIYGLLADTSDVAEQLEVVQGLIPQDAFAILRDQLIKVAQGNEAKLGFGLAASLALALWSATKGSKALMTAMNIAYDEKEQRNFLMANTVAISFTVGATLFVIIALGAIAAIPAAVEFLGLSEPLATVLLLLRWVLMAVLVVAGLAVLYRYAPSRRGARLQWLTPGALAATLLWLVASIAFSFYVTNFGSYNKTFGSLGAVVTLLMWFYLSVYIVCLGAELNAELEHQTYRDSTTGPRRPAGSRGAYVADHTID